MRRFSEVLLLVLSFTLLPSLFVNGNEGLRPTVNFKPVRRNAAIRGLLVSRQSLCASGFIGCELTGCCPLGWNCCIDSNCCDIGTYCALASNGIIGCCPEGEVCSGPVGGPTTIIGPPPPTGPLPPPVPSITPTVNPLPLPTSIINSVPPSTQTTLNPGPVPSRTSTSTPTFVSSSPSTSTATANSFPIFGAAVGQARLYRPLLVLVVGILLAVVMY